MKIAILLLHVTINLVGTPAIRIIMQKSNGKVRIKDVTLIILN